MSTELQGVLGNSYERLWSLWDMLDKHALLFASAMSYLSDAKWVCGSPLTYDEATEDYRADLVNRTSKEGIRLLRQACILSEVDQIVPQVDRLEIALWPDKPGMTRADDKTLALSFNQLISRIKDELDGQYFFHVAQSDVPFYAADKPFGDAVARRFELANEDVSEAAKCLALQRPVACVFHLMRVMERGVQAFGKKMKISIDPKSETWAQIMMHVDNGIKKMPIDTPRRKAKKARYALAAAHLDHVRLAWRNEVMHPKQTYTRQEAFDVFNAVRVFMNELAETI